MTPTEAIDALRRVIAGYEQTQRDEETPTCEADFYCKGCRKLATRCVCSDLVFGYAPALLAIAAEAERQDTAAHGTTPFAPLLAALTVEQEGLVS